LFSLSVTYDVFISHPPGARKIAEALLVWLERRGVRCFAAFRDLPQGVPWKDAVPPAIRESRVLLAVFADGVHGASAPVYEEVSTAIEMGRPIFPFRLKPLAKDTSYAPNWQGLDWMEAFPNPQVTFAKITRNLVKYLAKSAASLGTPDVAAMASDAPPRWDDVGMESEEEDVPVRRGGQVVAALVIIAVFVAIGCLWYFDAASLGSGLRELGASRQLERKADAARFAAGKTPAVFADAGAARDSVPRFPAQVPAPVSTATSSAAATAPALERSSSATLPPAFPATGVVDGGAGVAAPLRFSGVLRALGEVEVVAGISGVVVEIRPSEGDTVTRGQVLARFDSKEQTQKIANAREELERAMKNVEGAEKLLAASEAVVRRNQARREETAGMAPSQSDWERAIAAADDARSTLGLAKTVLEERRKGLGDAERALEKILLAAPVDGLVLKRSLEIGQVVHAPGEVLFRIAPTPLRLGTTLTVSGADLSRVTEGGPVVLTATSVAGAFTGKITKIEPMGKEISGLSPLHSVEIDIESPLPPRLRPGSPVTVEIGR
jgi:multidrug efflux pump subunit AcrA (membrane-fusion protein)